MDANPVQDTKLFIPALRGFYDRVVPLSYTLIRITCGLMLIPHGWPKLMQGAQAFGAASLARRGIDPMFAYIIIFNETLGALMLAAGLLTRLVAASIAIQMLVIVIIYLPKGFGWTHPGYEYVLMWGLIAFALALGGGGPYSLDRKIGREL